MAIDILSIPAMSAEPERVFSGAKHTLTQHRNRLGMEPIRAFECLKSWAKLRDYDEGFALGDEMLVKESMVDDITTSVLERTLTGLVPDVYSDIF
jgi:hypothetical protein